MANKFIYVKWLFSALCLITCVNSLLMLSSCKEEETPPPAPVITSFSPASGSIGATVTIIGQNFSTSPLPSITFNGISAQVVSGSDTQLVTTVPVNATTGKIVVTTPLAVTTSSTDFVVFQTPTIASFSPASGVVGSIITITGTNFSTNATNNVVKVNGVTATIASATATSIIIPIPANATTGKITVTVDGQTATSTAPFIVKKAPTITSFTPTFGGVGTQVEITGTNFVGQVTPAVVKFNSEVMTLKQVSDTKITLSMSGAASSNTSGKFTVTVDDLSATSVENFTLVAPPIITSFEPKWGLPGTQITINGSGLGSTVGGTVVKVGGQTASIALANDNQLVVNLPQSVVTGKIELTRLTTGLTTTSTDIFEVLLDIPRNNLVAFYPFNGDAKDYSPNGLDGTISGATSNTDRYNNAGHAYSFNTSPVTGFTDYINVGNPDKLRITHAITISFWVKKADFSTGTVISKQLWTDDEQTEGHGYAIHLRQSGAIKAYVAEVRYPGHGLQGPNFNDGVNFTPNVWQHFILTMTGETARFYLNGVMVNEKVNHQPIIASTFGNFYIGMAQEQPSVPFNGFIDDVAIYDRALTTDEAMQLFKQTITKH